MARIPWTEQEIVDVLILPWSAFRGKYPHRGFDSFETKRRRLMKGVVVDEAFVSDESLDADEAALQHDLVAPAVRGLDPSVEPNLGAKVAIPPVVNFNIGFFDYETTDLKANFGRILGFVVADQFGDTISLRADDPSFEGRNRRDDSKIAVASRDILEQFEILVSWNGKRFDQRFLNGRLVLADERPLRGDLMHIDALPISRHYFAWHSHRLAAVQKTLRLGNSKTELDPETWEAAKDFEPWAMDYVMEHCVADTLVLRDTFWRYRRVIKIVHR